MSRTPATQLNLREISTVGEGLADGTLIELIREQPDAEPRLLVWNGTEARSMPRFDHKGVTYTPHPLDATVARAIRLPERAAEYGTIAKLFSELTDLISRATRCGPGTVQRVAFYVIASWFTDCLTQAPFLWIIAPPTAATQTLRQLLPIVCRRVLFVPGLTLAGLRSLPMMLRPTIFTETASVTPSLLKVLAASNRREAYIPSGKGLLDVSCAKIVIANQPLRDSAAVGFPLEATLIPSREYIPVMGAAEAKRVASEFQAKLLMYRLRNFGQLAPPILDLRELTAPTQELAVSLATCIVGDEKLRSQIIPLLKERDQQIQVDRTTVLESILLEGLLAACHDPQKLNLSVVELTQSVNTIFLGRGEAQQVSPEQVGWRLRAVGLHTAFLSGGRKGLVLAEATRATIHKLAAAYGVRTLRSEIGNRNCRHCPAA